MRRMRWRWIAWQGALAVMLMGGARLAAQAPLKVARVMEQWRVDGSESGRAFGDVRDLLALPDGQLWVLDFKDQEIRRYDAAGTFRGVTARPGAGPGELRNADGMLLHGDGTVWVNDPMNGRLSVFGTSGAFLRQHPLAIGGWRYRWEAWFDRRTHTVVDPRFGPGVDGTARRISVRGTVLGTLVLPACKQVLGSLGYKAQTKGRGGLQANYPFTFGGGVAGDPAGGYWCAPVDGTRAVRLGLERRDTLARTDLELPPIAVSAAERQARIADVQKRVATFSWSDFDPSRVPSSKPPILGLWVDHDGRLWVRHADRFGVRQSVFDVHDHQGRHLARVTIPARSSEFLPVQSRGDRLWLTIVDDDDVPWVTQYRVTWPR
ncbi:MAG: hypothetical protein K2R93_08180 [Gemmatimonadaceae bacterium]|nr:hypothetical protein [Gemmatimonadaceae bacterium]